MPLALSNEPLAVIQIDETGPVFLGRDGHYVKVWILIAVEVVTRLVYLIPLKSQGTTDLVMTLDISQNGRGRLSRIVVDQLTTHAALKTNNTHGLQPSVKNVSPTLRDITKRPISPHK